MNNNKDVLKTIIDFLFSINIKVVEQELPNNTFLPGLSLAGNSILLDINKLKYPGDVLHEAAHIAVTEAHIRPLIGTSATGDNWPTEGDEIAAILWSFATAKYLNLDLKIVFHPDGYKNESEWLIEQFNSKNYIGLPLLEWMSLCNKDEFPTMKKWIR